MRAAIKSFITLIRETLDEWSHDHTTAVAASLAYYAVFALSPILIIMAVTVGTVIDRNQVESEIIGGVESTVGEEAARTIDSLLDNNTREETDLLGTIVWFGVVIWGSSGMFTQLQNALNKIWEVKPMPNRPLLAFVENRVLSFAIVLTVNLFLLSTLVINTGISILIVNFEELADVAFLIRPLQLLVTVTMLTVLVALVFKVLPDVQITWPDVITGAVFTSVLFFAGQFVVGLYLANASVGSAFGAAGSLTVVLVWIYYSAQIFLFGAQFTEVWARHHGHYIRPSRRSGWRNITRTQEELRRAGIMLDAEDMVYKGRDARRDTLETPAVNTDNADEQSS